MSRWFEKFPWQVGNKPVCVEEMGDVRDKTRGSQRRRGQINGHVTDLSRTSRGSRHSAIWAIFIYTHPTSKPWLYATGEACYVDVCSARQWLDSRPLTQKQFVDVMVRSMARKAVPTECQLCTCITDDAQVGVSQCRSCHRRLPFILVINQLLLSSNPHQFENNAYHLLFGPGKAPQALRTLFLLLFLFLSDFRKFPKALSVRNQSLNFV